MKVKISNHSNIDSHQLEAIKINQDIIKRMHDSSQRIKNYFLTLSGAIIIFMGSKSIDNPYFLIGFIFIISAFWYMDSRYLQLERSFIKHHNAILDGNIDCLEQFRFNAKAYKKDNLIKLMFLNFTMIIYPIMIIISLFMFIYLL